MALNPSSIARTSPQHALGKFIVLIEKELKISCLHSILTYVSLDFTVLVSVLVFTSYKASVVLILAVIHSCYLSVFSETTALGLKHHASSCPAIFQTARYIEFINNIWKIIVFQKFFQLLSSKNFFSSSTPIFYKNLRGNFTINCRSSGVILIW